MNTPLVVFPMVLFGLALLALLSGIGVIYRQRNPQGGFFTSFVWAIFSGSISMGFMVFATFVYKTQGNLLLAGGIGIAGLLLVMLAGWLATR